MANSPDSRAPDAESDKPGEEQFEQSGISQRDKTDKILADGDRRDNEAAARDIAADERSRAADLEAFLNVDEDYSGHGERRAAAQDRAHAKGDREKSADDRAQLSADSDTDSDGASP